MFRWISSCSIALLVVMIAGPVAAAPFNVVTASENGTYIRIGNDLANFVGQPAGLDMRALPSKGSVENLRRLREERGTKMALVQADVYQAYKDLASKGNAEAGRLVKPVRVVLPLYDEEIYVVVRSDSPMQSISEIRDQRINIGPIGSGTAMTASTLYKAMFDAPMADNKVSTLTNEEALVQLVRDRTIDVVIAVAGQPATLFLGMEPGVEKYFKLLRADDSPAIKSAMATYSPSEVRATSYPNWLSQDQPTLAVKTLLVTYDYPASPSRDSLVRFAKSLCENFSTLQKQGHPKWREVSLQLPPLSAGWSYYQPTARQMGHCKDMPAKVERPTMTASSKPTCPLQDKVLGLCPSP